MEQYSFSNSDIDLACGRVAEFLASAGVERREALRIRLAFEEVLLEYQSAFGPEAMYKLRCARRFSGIKVELEFMGQSLNPLEKDGEDGTLVNGLLAGIGLAPTWSYKNGKNYIVFIPKKKNVSQMVKMFTAIALSVVVGLLLTLLPRNIREGISDNFLSPVTDLFMGIISATAGPFIFLSVLGSICSMGNTETLGKIGKRTVLTIMGYMSVVGLILTAIASLFYDVTSGGSIGSDFSKILELIYNIVPANIFDPFISGNSLQIIFIAVIFGIAMLMLASKVNFVFTIVEQTSAIVQTVMSIVLEALPFAVFIIFTNMIAGGSIEEIVGSYKMILQMLLLIVVYLVFMILWISLRKKISPILLIKKILPTFIIAITTASSAAAFSTNIRDSQKKLGIDKKLADFGIPLGQVLFKPCEFAIIIPMLLCFSESSGIEITLSWLVLSYITVWLVSFAVPPVAGGALMGFTIAFTQLGIPLSVMGIVIAINTITDFPATAMNVTGWQLTMIEVADSLGLLNKDKLRKGE